MAILMYYTCADLNLWRFEMAQNYADVFQIETCLLKNSSWSPIFEFLLQKRRLEAKENKLFLLSKKNLWEKSWKQKQPISIWKI